MKAYNNVTYAPEWDIKLEHVAPPYLYLLLGITKIHHLLLEGECHTLDEETAKALSTEDTPVDESTSFGKLIANNKLIGTKEVEKIGWRQGGQDVLFWRHMAFPPSFPPALTANSGHQLVSFKLRVSPQWLSGLRQLWRPRSCRFSVGVSFS